MSRDDDLARVARQAEIAATICARTGGHRLEGRVLMRELEQEGAVVDGADGICLHCGMTITWRDPRPDPPAAGLPDPPDG